MKSGSIDPLKSKWWKVRETGARHFKQPQPFNSIASEVLIYVFCSGTPGLPSITSADIEASSLRVKWIAPADDGGSPITAYRVVILQDRNVTDPDTKELFIEGLNSNTNYTVKIHVRNHVFEGNASSKTFKTTCEGKASSCTFLASVIHWHFLIYRCFFQF